VYWRKKISYEVIKMTEPICGGCGKEIGEERDVLFFISVWDKERTRTIKKRVHLNKKCIEKYLKKLKKELGELCESGLG